MGKMRNYVYGSPKFEGEINKAVPPEGSDIRSTGELSGKVLTSDGSGGSSWEDASGGGKLYRHKVDIAVRDANYTDYYFGIILYSTSATPFFATPTPTIDDIVAFITPLLDLYSQTPAYINDGVEYHFEKVTDGIEGISLVYNTAEYGRSAITNVVGAVDTVAEV